MDRQVVEEEDVARLRRHRLAVLERHLQRVALARRLERALPVRARDDTQAPVLQVGVVEVDARGEHRVPLVREVRVVLVHRERRSLLRRLDQHLRVVELHVRPDQRRQDRRQPRVARGAREGGVVVLHVVEALQDGLLGDRLPDVVLVVLGPAHALEDPVDRRPHLLDLRAVEDAARVQVAVLRVELDVAHSLPPSRATAGRGGRRSRRAAAGAAPSARAGAPSGRRRRASPSTPRGRRASRTRRRGTRPRPPRGKLVGVDALREHDPRARQHVVDLAATSA